jgi:hypothetical protein
MIQHLSVITAISVIPAKAGIAGGSCSAPPPEAPAFAGATRKGAAQ